MNSESTLLHTVTIYIQIYLPYFAYFAEQIRFSFPNSEIKQADFTSVYLYNQTTLLVGSGSVIATELPLKYNTIIYKSVGIYNTMVVTRSLHPSL